MIVVSDTSPLNYLILIGEVTLLPDLLGEVVIPVAVFRELQAERTPPIVREFTVSMPAWLTVREANLISDIDDAEFEELGAGEREAILLVQELHAEALLIDDLAGRKLALKHNLPVVGTVGILERAADKGLIDLRIALEKLKLNGFFLSAKLERAFLEKRTE